MAEEVEHTQCILVFCTVLLEEIPFDAAPGVGVAVDDAGPVLGVGFALQGVVLGEPGLPAARWGKRTRCASAGPPRSAE